MSIHLLLCFKLATLITLRRVLVSFSPSSLIQISHLNHFKKSSSVLFTFFFLSLVAILIQLMPSKGTSVPVFPRRVLTVTIESITYILITYFLITLNFLKTCFESPVVTLVILLTDSSMHSTV